MLKIISAIELEGEYEILFNREFSISNKEWKMKGETIFENEKMTFKKPVITERLKIEGG